MRSLFFCSLLLLCVANTFSQHAVSQKLDALFSNVFNPAEPGGAVLIVKNGTVIYKNAFGVADLNTKKKITTQSLFNVGSISKTFVAYGILNLAKEGSFRSMMTLKNISPALKILPWQSR